MMQSVNLAWEKRIDLEIDYFSIVLNDLVFNYLLGCSVLVGVYLAICYVTVARLSVLIQRFGTHSFAFTRDQ